jgi:hypothetical protein
LKTPGRLVENGAAMDTAMTIGAEVARCETAGVVNETCDAGLHVHWRPADAA